LEPQAGPIENSFCLMSLSYSISKFVVDIEQTTGGRFK
ncbi:MAG: hypothetical protein ACJASL_003880, partial [Paraglaciecola sp.]